MTTSDLRSEADEAVPATPPSEDIVRPDNGYNYGSVSPYNRVENVPSQQQLPKPTKPKTRALAPDLLRGFLMLAMALDHNAIALNSWQHGTGVVSEGDSAIVEQWNRPIAYVVRTLTHLCAPGFTFLLGMGVVYLGRSRTRLGWSSWRLARYFAVRGIVLTVLSAGLGLFVTGGKTWFMNIVLFSLAVDYFLAGMLWLLVNQTEPALARLVERALPDDTDAVEEPLISSNPPRNTKRSSQATAISWHIHNAVLLILSLVTIWWNIWLSWTHGHCRVEDKGSLLSSTATASDPQEQPGMGPNTSHNALLGIWFWPVVTKHVMSGFPPMAWISFAILGLLYGRVITARPWSARTLTLGHSVVGVLFFVLFVLTRLLRFGNLSEDCLETPEHHGLGSQTNPYLASAQSFFYIIKYPPDVAFWAFTLACNMFLLAIFGAIPVHISKRFSMLLDFGTAALFFYVVHLFVVFGVAGVLVALFGHDTDTPNPANPDQHKAIDNVFGYFGAWALAMLLMWPMTRAYSRFKSKKPADSIWRFF